MADGHQVKSLDATMINDTFEAVPPGPTQVLSALAPSIDDTQ